MGASDKDFRLSDEVAQSLEQWIVAEGLSVGSKMPTEKLLCEKFGVSRPVIREAMARLKADGCVRTRQGSGAYLAALPGQNGFRLIQFGQALSAAVSRELAEVLELRLIVETGMAELAAVRRTAEDIQLMKMALAAMDQALQKGVEASSDDDAFHVAIAAATHNPQLKRFQIFMGQQLSDSRRPTWASGGHLNGFARQAQLEHRAIYNAIVIGDAAAAREAARMHIGGAMKRFGVVRGDLPPPGDSLQSFEEINL